MSSRNWRQPTLSIGAIFALAACGGEPTPPPPPPAAPQSAASDAHLDAMDKARAVEATLQEGRDRTDAALEEAEKR